MVESNTIYAPKTKHYKPNTSGNHVSTSDHVDFDVTDTLDIIWRGSVPSWSVTEQQLVAKWTSTNRSFFFLIGANQALRFRVYNGAIVTLIDTSIAFLTPGNTYSFKVSYIKNLGGVTNCKLYYRINDGDTWVLLNSVNHLSIIDIDDSSAILELTSREAGTAGIDSASVHTEYAKIYVDGTLVAEADFSYPWANNKYRDKTGKIWTINGSAWAWEYQDDPEDRYA